MARGWLQVWLHVGQGRQKILEIHGQVWGRKMAEDPGSFLLRTQSGTETKKVTVRTSSISQTLHASPHPGILVRTACSWLKPWPRVWAGCFGHQSWENDKFMECRAWASVARGPPLTHGAILHRNNSGREKRTKGTSSEPGVCPFAVL